MLASPTASPETGPLARPAVSVLGTTAVSEPEAPSGPGLYVANGNTKPLQSAGPSATLAQPSASKIINFPPWLTNELSVEVDTQGDAFFVAFATAPDALAAAMDAQSALAAGPIRVRMGLHTGTPTVTDDGYVGEVVHLGARIAAAGHGGQVLLSKATGDLVDEPLTDLGEHRVKDFEQPVWIYQLGELRFPPLKTISNTNLPRPASSPTQETRLFYRCVTRAGVTAGRCDCKATVTVRGRAAGADVVVVQIPEQREGVRCRGRTMSLDRLDISTNVGVAGSRDPASVARRR